MNKLSVVLASVLLWPTAATAQVAEFYHLDATGNVLAVTNQSGQVLETHDYLPFGEELCGSLPCGQPGPGQPKRFTGKERDNETGFDYFGARYYRANLGRFTTVDPVYTWKDNLVDPQRWNRYAYGLNNPFRYVDTDGKWPTKVMEVHQASIDRVLALLRPNDREVLKITQVEMDTDQSSAGAPKHALRAPGQTVENARTQANEFVRSELEQARKLEQAGAHVSAMAHLGNAMHTLQDSTSPAHEGFQVWDDKWNSVWSSEGRAHVKKEFYDPGKGSALDQATARAYDYFTGKRELPKDFFDQKK